MCFNKFSGVKVQHLPPKYNKHKFKVAENGIIQVQSENSTWLNVGLGPEVFGQWQLSSFFYI